MNNKRGLFVITLATMLLSPRHSPDSTCYQILAQKHGTPDHLCLFFKEGEYRIQKNGDLYIADSDYSLTFLRQTWLELLKKTLKTHEINLHQEEIEELGTVLVGKDRWKNDIFIQKADDYVAYQQCKVMNPRKWYLCKCSVDYGLEYLFSHDRYKQYSEISERRFFSNCVNAAKSYDRSLRYTLQ